MTPEDIGPLGNGDTPAKTVPRKTAANKTRKRATTRKTTRKRASTRKRATKRQPRKAAAARQEPQQVIAIRVPVTPAEEAFIKKVSDRDRAIINMLIARGTFI